MFCLTAWNPGEDGVPDQDVNCEAAVAVQQLGSSDLSALLFDKHTKGAYCSVSVSVAAVTNRNTAPLLQVQTQDSFVAVTMAEQQLFEALQALYHHPDEKVKKQADEWLEAWQQAPEAWQISSTVLESASGSTEAHYFCAVTLRTKVTSPRTFQSSVLALAFKMALAS